MYSKSFNFFSLFFLLFPDFFRFISKDVRRGSSPVIYTPFTHEISDAEGKCRSFPQSVNTLHPIFSLCVAELLSSLTTVCSNAFIFSNMIHWSEILLPFLGMKKLTPNLRKSACRFSSAFASQRVSTFLYSFDFDACYVDLIMFGRCFSTSFSLHQTLDSQSRIPA